MTSKLKKFVKNPLLIFETLGHYGILNWLSDEKYLKILYRIRTGKKLNLEDPQTFNEKMQWLKLHDRQPIYSDMVDKYEVKRYVANLIGEEYVIPTLGVWEKFDDIDFDSLPNRFVLKCTHDSGGLIICKDKSKLDLKKVKKKITRCLKCNYFYGNREWPYKNVKPRIIAEQYMEDENGVGEKKNSSLLVYKFFCFDSEPRIVQTIQNDKLPNESIDYFSTQWELLDIKQNFPNSAKPLDKPKNLEEMLNLVKTLAKVKQGFLRVDLYSIGGKPYFSEYTFFSDSGMANFVPKKWDSVLGEWLKIS